MDSSWLLYAGLGGCQDSMRTFNFVAERFEFDSRLSAPCIRRTLCKPMLRKRGYRIEPGVRRKRTRAIDRIGVRLSRGLQAPARPGGAVLTAGGGRVWWNGRRKFARAERTRGAVAGTTRVRVRVRGWGNVSPASCASGTKGNEAYGVLGGAGGALRARMTQLEQGAASHGQAPYTMGPGQNAGGVVIRRHDLTKFRQQAAAGAALPAKPGDLPGVAP